MNPAEDIWRAGVAGADAEALVRRHVSMVARGVLGAGRHSVGVSGRVWLFGAGKAAIGMARGVAAVVDVAGGLLVGDGEGAPVPVIPGAHPFPDGRSVAAADRMLAEIGRVPPQDLVIAVWSGGGSSLLGAPIDGLTPDELAGIGRTLLDAGAPITDVNAVRRRLGRAAGGRLRAASKAPILNLALSDVPGAGERWADDPVHHATIASGPAVRDPTTREDAAQILRDHGLERFVGALGADVDVPRSPYLVVGNAESAVHTASHRARQLGWVPLVVSAHETAPVADVVSRLLAALRTVAGGPPMALIVAGEPSLRVEGVGVGGRSSHAAALFARELAAQGMDAVAACGGTDGVDGRSAAAGGVVDRTSADSTLDAAIAGFDTATWLDRRGCALVSGPTGTQVGDLWVVLAGSPPTG